MTMTLRERLQALISTPSVSCTSPQQDMGNRAVIDLLAQWFAGLGFTVEIMPLPHHPQKANLIATLGSGSGGLVLSGHTDTVPCDDSLWQSSPFTLTERDNRFYGLGTADMKSFFALVLEAVAGLDAATLKAPLIVLATADEESSMSGVRALVAAGRPKARYAVIGEPTSLKPVRMHKGIMMEAIRVEGRAGHSSNPALGNNALETMHTVMGKLLDYRDELQARYHNPLFNVAVPTLNLGHIHGGDNPNRICGQCELHFDLRPLPGMNLDELRGNIDRLLQSIPQHEHVCIKRIPLIDGIEPFEQDANASLVQAAERMTGHPSIAVAFATEAPFLQQLGMQTLILGPGNIDQAHQPDEYLAFDQINPSIDLLKQLIRQFCQ